MRIACFLLGYVIISSSCGEAAGTLQKETKVAATTADTTGNNKQRIDIAARRELTAAYHVAIAAYVKETYRERTLPDTLFIGKHPDFPDITLEPSIGDLSVFMLTESEARKKLSYRTTLAYVNIIHWPHPQTPEFLFITFEKFRPQHNCTVQLKRDDKTGSFSVANISLQYPYGKQKKNH